MHKQQDTRTPSEMNREERAKAEELADKLKPKQHGDITGWKFWIWACAATILILALACMLVFVSL